MVRLARALAALATLLLACGPGKGPAPSSPSSARLPDLRIAKDRPPVALVARDGDPAGAIAVAVTTARDDDPDAAVALSGLAEARFAARGIAAAVTPGWDGYRAVMLAATDAEAKAAAEALRTALTAPADERDLAAAKKKLDALAARPLRDPALARWAKCIGAPYAKPAKAPEELTIARLEQWRAAAHGTGHVAIGVAAESKTAEAVATAIVGGPAWPAGAPFAPTPRAGAALDADVYEAPPDAANAPNLVRVHATLDVGTSSTAVAVAEALGDRQGPLVARLESLDLPFRLRDVVGTAHAYGGCVGVVLEAAPGGAIGADDLAARVADAVALVQVEARLPSTEGGPPVDGRALARKEGDARDAAEHAAWWALSDARAIDPPSRGSGSVALGLPMRRAAPKEGAPPLEPTPQALATAIERAAAAYEKPVIEGRTRVEAGQGETWVLVGSPCGTDGESEADAGLTMLATLATAFSARPSPGARIEPWVVPDGAGLLVHGPALPGETPAAHARRLADLVARTFATEPLSSQAIALARAEAHRQETRLGVDGLATLATLLSPTRPSAVLPWGHADAIARASDAAVLARAQALRTGPLRVAVIADVDAAQADAAVRAADRWTERQSREAKTCRGAAAERAAPRPGTYAVAPRRDSTGSSTPEALLAFPVADADRAAAQVVVDATDGPGGLLERALANADARVATVRLVGAPRAPAIVVRIGAAQDKLDAAVMQARALVAKIHEAGLGQADYDRAVAVGARNERETSLAPGARVVALFRGDDIPSPAKKPKARPAIDVVRAFAQRDLGEDALIVVASRPQPSRTPPPPTGKSP